MLTRKGNLICKALVFTFAVITAMTLDSCCDDCLGGSKGNKNQNLINNNPKHGGTETSNEDKEKVGFKKTNDGKLWIFGIPLFYSAKDGKLRFGDKEVTTSIFRYIANRYIAGYNSEINEGRELNGAILGDAGVGKTKIVGREVNNKFEEGYKETALFAYYDKEFSFNNEPFYLQILDVSGKQTMRKTISALFGGASIIILVYDVKKRESFEDLNSWYNEIKNKQPPGAAIFVVGNKCDLIEKDKISAQEKEVKNWINSKCEQK